MRYFTINCSEKRHLFERCEKSFGHTVLLGPNNPLHFNRIPSQSFIKDSLDDIFEKGTTNHKGYYATLVKTIKNIIPVPL